MRPFLAFIWLKVSLCGIYCLSLLPQAHPPVLHQSPLSRTYYLFFIFLISPSCAENESYSHLISCKHLSLIRLMQHSTTEPNSTPTETTGTCRTCWFKALSSSLLFKYISHLCWLLHDPHAIYRKIKLGSWKLKKLKSQVPGGGELEKFQPEKVHGINSSQVNQPNFIPNHIGTGRKSQHKRS